MSKARLILFGWVIIVLGLGATAAADDGASRYDNHINLFIDQSTIVKAPWPTIRVSITEPEIADFKVLTENQILVQGKAVGATDLIMWSEDEKEVWRTQIKINLDISGVIDSLKTLFPSTSLDVTQSRDVLIVKGQLARAEDALQLHNYLETTGMKYVDMTGVAGVQQVQINVKVAEVSRTVLNMLGMNAFHTNDGFFGGSTVGSANGGPINPVSIGPLQGALAQSNLDYFFTSDVSVSPGVTVFAGFPDADLQLFMQALSENQYLRILANPTLVALSGEEASFLAGGEFPIPVVQGSSAGASNAGTSITIEYKEFGVRLRFRPTVMGDNTIRLHVAPEVNELTDQGAVVIQGFQIPAVITRKSETTIELKSGQTFAMAGLLRQNVQGITSKVPGIGELPILGSLFRSHRYSIDETELVIMVTASLVDPLNLAAETPLPGFLHTGPSEWEFFGEGKIESRTSVLSDADAAWLRKNGLDRLLGPGAWDNYDKPMVQSNADMATTDFKPKINPELE